MRNRKSLKDTQYYDKERAEEKQTNCQENITQINKETFCSFCMYF